MPWLRGGKGNLNNAPTPNGLCKSGGGNSGCLRFGTGGGAVEVPEEHPDELLDAELDEWLLLLLDFDDPGEDSTYILIPCACWTCCTRRHAEWSRALHVEHT